jgi:hypothetical protein
MFEITITCLVEPSEYKVKGLSAESVVESIVLQAQRSVFILRCPLEHKEADVAFDVLNKLGQQYAVQNVKFFLPKCENPAFTHESFDNAPSSPSVALSRIVEAFSAGNVRFVENVKKTQPAPAAGKAQARAKGQGQGTTSRALLWCSCTRVPRCKRSKTSSMKWDGTHRGKTPPRLVYLSTIIAEGATAKWHTTVCKCVCSACTTPGERPARALEKLQSKYACACMQEHMRVYVYACKDTQHTCTHTRTYTCTHTHMHTYTYLYI